MSAFEHSADNQAIGRDPRAMTQAELIEAGHTPKPVLTAMRERCLQCCCGNPAEVRACVAVKCAAWPFRMGTNPWRAPVSEARREQARRNGERLKRPNGSGEGA